MAASLRHISYRIGIQSQVLIVLRRLGQRQRELFLLGRREKNNPCFRRSEGIQQRFQSLDEARQALPPLERFVRAVADDEDRRLEGKDMIFQMLESVGLGAEAGAG